MALFTTEELTSERITYYLKILGYIGHKVFVRQML